MFSNKSTIPSTLPFSVYVWKEGKALKINSEYKMTKMLLHDTIIFKINFTLFIYLFIYLMFKCLFILFLDDIRSTGAYLERTYYTNDASESRGKTKDDQCTFCCLSALYVSFCPSVCMYMCLTTKEPISTKLCTNHLWVCGSKPLQLSQHTEKQRTYRSSLKSSVCSTIFQ
jgi:hypothetical protein